MQLLGKGGLESVLRRKNKLNIVFGLSCEVLRQPIFCAICCLCIIMRAKSAKTFVCYIFFSYLSG